MPRPANPNRVSVRLIPAPDGRLTAFVSGSDRTEDAESIAELRKALDERRSVICVGPDWAVEWL